MKAIKIVFAVLAVMLAFSTASFAFMDIEEFPTGYFTPTYTTDSPYYRWYNEDWGWTHDALALPTTSATLSIGAWDVDYASGEVDEIYAWDSGAKTLVGTLTGTDGAWSYATFTLGSNFFDDIATGLEIWIDIDSTNDEETWAVLLSKSVLITDGIGTLPGPEPSPTPEPITLFLLGLGLLGVAGAKKALKK